MDKKQRDIIRARCEDSKKDCFSSVWAQMGIELLNALDAMETIGREHGDDMQWEKNRRQKAESDRDYWRARAEDAEFMLLNKSKR
jgi:hypothetical protein